MGGAACANYARCQAKDFFFQWHCFGFSVCLQAAAAGLAAAPTGLRRGAGQWAARGVMGRQARWVS